MHGNQVNCQSKQDIEFENSNQWREIKYLWVDPFQKMTSPNNLPLLPLRFYVKLKIRGFNIGLKKAASTNIP